ncbi:hypothetical protein HO173_000957 [Letharia columbiana]|uniref:AAA+ ATPase domain-containing protein n=1 Tax=Letharia columbiana TaxID=112416 RepID=A0A8H6G608_9LECA|nr:uncharacterized protein HO173_000957 [Letharia columbiana]KAF6241163.1 hypothetical protein HO173_000957 [Letharia columbiana]
MMRNKASSSMQKTYDECYLVCSTAVYFEGQNNEAEALRSWRSALDQIYYHNAYRVPPNYQPKSETERALQESLRNMELQCKERVDLLEALRKSRKEAKDNGDRSSSSSTTLGRPPVPTKPDHPVGHQANTGWLGEGTVPAVNYPDLSKAPPALPRRPLLSARDSNYSPTDRSYSSPQVSTMSSTTPYTPPTLPVPPTKTPRTPSPDKKGHVMLTTLRGLKDGKKQSKSPRASGGRFGAPPVSSKAAGLAWDSISKGSGQKLGQTLAGRNGSTNTVDSVHRDSVGGNTSSRPDSTNVTDGEEQALGGNALVRPDARTPPDLIPLQDDARPSTSSTLQSISSQQNANGSSSLRPQTSADLMTLEPPTPPLHADTLRDPMVTKVRAKSPARPKAPVDYPSYRTEFPQTTASSRATAQFLARTNRSDDSARASSLPMRQRSPQRKTRPPVPTSIARRPVANISSPRSNKHETDESGRRVSSESNDDNTSSSYEKEEKKRRPPRKARENPIPVDPALESTKPDKDPSDTTQPSSAWHERVKYIKKNLPKGVDEGAAKQIFNEIVVQGDEVHWADVAGLEVAKKALKEAVVYPFLRPDLFMGLREPARGMLLFGPPGTGKTMLARAVATESRSTFFAISASSLTSKWLGESEKLVRALFSLAKALAPSIIFVDEIDSLLSSRGGSSEHESTRRIKTEFLIQWSDLQRAAAGSKQTDKEKAEGDASRVLVLAATNMPWAIDEAARRRFVRRQYIPLPEAPVRGEQLKTLLGHQKHNLSKKDIEVLVELTDGFSGSDITALAKDAAMGPLRSLGEALLYMSTDEIRPIQFEDFEASLINIRPSVSKQGLQEFEDWAKEFGERGG